MFKTWNLLTAMLCFIAGTTAFCQDFPMLHYTVDDGLPSNNVYQVYRDRKGFLWIATDKGVARYNGIKFEKFTTYNGLADNEVFSFLEDYYGRLWLGTYNGKLCFYQDGVFHSAANTPFLRIPTKVSYIFNINLSPDSTVSFNLSNSKLLLSVGKNDCFMRDLSSVHMLDRYVFPHKRKIAADRYELTADSSDIIIDTSGNIIEIIHRNSCFRVALTLSQDKKYFFNRDTIYTEDKKAIAPLKKDFLQNNFVHVYYSDSTNFFWTTNRGLFINDSIHILRESNVSTITSDVKGNYWVGTLNNGLYCLKKNFINTRVVSKVYDGSVNYFYCDSGHLFFTVTNNNLLLFANGRVLTLFDFRKFKKDRYTYKAIPGYLIEKKKNTYNYYNIYDRDNINIHDVLSAQPAFYRFDNDYFSLSIKAMYAAGNDIYIKGREKIIRIDNSKSIIGNQIKTVYSPDTASGYRIFGMAKAADNTLFFSTINNVYKIENGVSRIQKQFNNLAFKTLGIYNNYLLGITHDNKLIICNNIEGKIAIDSITNQDCVWDKFFRLNENQVIISTNNIYRLITLYPSENVPKYSIVAVESPFIPLFAEAICSDNHTCYFLKDGSITTIKVNDLYEKSDPPKLFFANLKTGEKNYRIDDQVQIAFGESKNLRVSYNTLSFGGRGISYQYSFSKNEQDNWIDVKGEEINLVNSDYGAYVIKVRARTISSSYCAPIVFTLQILKPYWATWWFIVLSVCFGVSLAAFLIRYRILYELRKKEKEHGNQIKHLKSEYKALNALMNPHFIFNTLNNVQSLVNKNEKVAANKYLGIFANLIRQNMHNISLELIPLQKEIDVITNYLELEKLRFKDMLNYAINIDDKIEPSDIMIPPLLIQPLVENSIKHGLLPRKSTDNFISIDVFERNSFLIINVKDNGIGIDAAQKRSNSLHESYGLENIRKRIAQLSIIQNKQITIHIGEIKDDEGIVLWTLVSVSISIS